MILGIAIAVAVTAFIALFFVMRDLINLEDTPRAAREQAAAEPLPVAASGVASASVR